MSYLCISYILYSYVTYSIICSTPVSEDDGGSSAFNGGDNMKQNSEPTIGSCQIKNGIIKIRLSKLIDNKKDIGENDYEVSLCESDALIGCKTLSVPLSPLAPAVYSAYCANLKSKKKSHSRKSKKKGKKNGAFKESNKIEKLEDEMQLDIFEQNSVEICELENNSNAEHEMSAVNCQSENLENTVSKIELVPEDTMTQNHDLSSVDNVVNTENSSSCSLSENISHELQSNDVNIQNVVADESSVLPISHSGNTLSSSPKHDASSQLSNSEILCSINLALLDRVPRKQYFAVNHPNVQIYSNVIDDKEVKEESIFDSVHNTKNSISHGTFTTGKSSNVIKMERYTPPACELSGTVLDA